MRASIEPSIELHCEHCGYNVANVPHRRCPECGKIFNPHALQQEYARAQAVVRRVRRHMIFVPLLGGFIVGLWLGLARGMSGTLFGVVCFFLFASYCVALASTLAPEFVRARKALGHHPGANSPRLILLYSLALSSALVASLMFVAGVVAIVVARLA